MNTEIEQLKVHLRNLLDGCSKKYNFRAHTNNNKFRIRDTYFGGKIDEQNHDSIKRTMNCYDFFYFVINMTYKNDTYVTTNNLMRRETLTDISESAYKKARQRKSYTMFQDIFNSLGDYYKKLYEKYGITTTEAAKMADDDADAFTADDIDLLKNTFANHDEKGLEKDGIQTPICKNDTTDTKNEKIVALVDGAHYSWLKARPQIWFEIVQYKKMHD